MGFLIKHLKKRKTISKVSLVRSSPYNIKRLAAHLKDDSKTIICYDNVVFKEPLPKYIFIFTW